jgi:hypothetical protein
MYIYVCVYMCVYIEPVDIREYMCVFLVIAAGAHNL